MSKKRLPDIKTNKRENLRYKKIIEIKYCIILKFLDKHLTVKKVLMLINLLYLNNTDTNMDLS